LFAGVRAEGDDGGGGAAGGADPDGRSPLDGAGAAAAGGTREDVPPPLAADARRLVSGPMELKQASGREEYAADENRKAAVVVVRNRMLGWAAGVTSVLRVLFTRFIYVTGGGAFVQHPFLLW
jgi:hypothetical protein